MAKERSALKRVAIYLRVSTGEQTTDNQRRELEAVAMRHNWRVVDVFEDAGISGAEGRDKRPGPVAVDRPQRELLRGPGLALGAYPPPVAAEPYTTGHDLKKHASQERAGIGDRTGRSVHG